MLSLMMMLSGCCKPTVVTETETVTIYVPQYIPFDESLIECETVEIIRGDRYLEVIINQREMIDKCVSSIQAIINTVNNE